MISLKYLAILQLLEIRLKKAFSGKIQELTFLMDANHLANRNPMLASARVTRLGEISPKYVRPLKDS
jgi:hypothetical protein